MRVESEVLTSTAEKTLDIAERLVQVRGFNSVSYADVAAELGITKAALHYHFASKGELGEALITRYTTRFEASLRDIDQRTSDPLSKLAAYAGIYLDVVQQQRMCLCGMLAAEYQTLPPPMRVAVVRFFDINETWLEQVIAAGAAAGSMHPRSSARDAARVVISTLEGAMLVARLRDDPRLLEAAKDQLLAELS